MHNCIGVYLHGFLSSGKSEKGQWLVNQVRLEQQQSSEVVFSQFITVTYPIKSVAESINAIEKIIIQHKDNLAKIILLGSSMGGYYAQYFADKYQLPYVMINPALNPVPVFLQNQGEHINPSTGEHVCIDNAYIQDIEKYDIESLNPNLPGLLLIDIDDEVIDVDFAIQRYKKIEQNQGSLSKVVVYSGGDHRFIHMDDAWLKIKEFVQSLP